MLIAGKDRCMRAWENKVRKVVPYVPGEQPKDERMIKLNTNENPYPPSPNVAAAIDRLKADSLRLYPDPKVEKLVAKIADYHGLKENQVFVGVGSDDVLALAFMTFFNSDKNILFPDITYSFYDVWADLFRIPYQTKALDGDFRIIKEDYYGDNGGVIFPNPNAPTGIAMGLGEIEAIVKANKDVIVIVDEAYVDFGAESALPLIERYDNLLVVQTFSKSRSLAGIRIGYACGHEKLIKYLNDVKYSFNSYTMNYPSIEVGVAAIEDERYYQEHLAKVIETREWTKQELTKLGFSFGDSQANFIFATHKSCPAKTIYEALRQERIYVRYFAKERIDNYLRITIGTQAQMERLVEILKDFPGGGAS